MVGDLGHRVDISFFGRSRERVGDKVRLPLYISNVRRKFCNVAQLVLLFDRLRISFFIDGRYQTLMIGEECKWSAFHHLLEMADRLVGSQ